MVDLSLISPEVRYEVTRAHQADYLAVARAAESTAIALAAQWASDVCALQEHLWERFIIASPTPEDEFEKINGYLNSGFYQFTQGPRHDDSLAVLLSGREAVADVFADDSFLDGWVAKCGDTSYLGGRPTPTEADWLAVRDEHVYGVDTGEVLRRRQSAIQDQSNDLLGNRPILGDIGGHQRVWELDWTVFHAHLLDAAERCGDHLLISVDLRWRIAHAKAAELENIPMSVQEASSRWRNMLSDVLGPMEGTVLLSRFLPV